MLLQYRIINFSNESERLERICEAQMENQNNKVIEKSVNSRKNLETCSPIQIYKIQKGN